MTEISKPLKSLFDLTGQVAIVTGGSRGLGFQMAEALGEYGATVVLTARKQNELDAAVAKLTEQGAKAAAFAGDFSKEETVPAFIDWLKARYGRIDILVNNAGTSWGANAEDYPLDGWNKVFATNLTGPFLLTQQVAKEWLIPQKRGRVINIASVEGIQGHHVSMGGMVGYSAAKGGMVNLTRALAAEWGRYGITVNAIAPGYFPSKLTAVILQQIEGFVVENTPMGKLGNDNDLKGAALLFASDAGGHISGQVLAVDGGADGYLTLDFIDPRNLQFWLYDWLNAEALTLHPAYADHSRDTFDAILELSAKLAADRFATHYKKSDRVEPSLENGVVRVIPEIKQALAGYAEAGLFAASFDPEHGGLGLPHVVDAASLANFMAANIATAAFPMLTAANARVLVKFGTPAQIATFAIPEIEGKTFGTMCLSEPQAGSSLADVMTRAVPDGEDDLGPRYRLTGNKMWISSGDHDITDNIIHLVLAKIPGGDGKLPPGTGGITLFIVPKILPDGTRNDIGVAGLNHKMGYRGIPNCLLNFGEGGGALGWRLGQAGQGLAIMFTMMNEARIFVGLGAAALAVRGYRQSLDYARERLQGRRVSAKDPASPQRAIIGHADVKRMLLAQKAFAEGALSLILYCAHLIDRERVAGDEAERARLSNLLGLLTPVVKSWPSEFGLAANDFAIQIHGGYGYTRDFDVEQVYRDNRLNPIHEGTHGIQGIDLLGRKIVRDKAAGLAILGVEIAGTVARASTIEELRGLAGSLDRAWRQVDDVVRGLIASNDAARALDNASVFLSAFGHVVVAWLWLDQASAIHGNAGAGQAFREGKLRACRYFIEVELPKTGPQLDLVAGLNDVAATMPEDAF